MGNAALYKVSFFNRIEKLSILTSRCFAKSTMFIGKLKGMGYQRFGYSKIELYSAVVVGGRFVLRPPDECGVQLFTGDTVERRHICHDDKLKRLLDGDRATCEERRDPSPKRMRDATHGSPSGTF